MSDNIVTLHPAGVGDGFIVKPDQILTEAAGKYRALVLVGETDSGDIEVCGSGGAGDTLILLAWAQNFIVNNRVTR